MKITSHILDTALGKPAAGVRVALAARGEAGEWTEIGAGISDADGRVADLLAGAGAGDGEIPGRECKLTFDIAAYQRKVGAPVFHPRVEIAFCVGDGVDGNGDGDGGGDGDSGGNAHYHIPLLLSPFGYTTYRGS